jgi:hypothetical protein
MARYMTATLAAILVLGAGCLTDPNAEGGPYFEFTPGTEIDLGEVLKDTDAETTITIANISGLTWLMDINEDSIPNNVQLTCDDGEDAECLTVDPYGEHDWTLVVHTFCDDLGAANIRIHFSDPDSTGSAGDLGDVTLSITWETTGC